MQCTDTDVFPWLVSEIALNKGIPVNGGPKFLYHVKQHHVQFTTVLSSRVGRVSRVSRVSRVRVTAYCYH